MNYIYDNETQLILKQEARIATVFKELLTILTKEVQVLYLSDKVTF